MDFSVILENREFLLKGLYISFYLAIASGFISFFIGIILALARLSKKSLIKYPAIFYIEFIRSIPLIMFIFWVYFLLPIIIKIPLSDLSAAIIAFIACHCAYFAEVVRAGIQSIPSGQTHAGICSGLSYYKVMRFIILPQAISVMTPALINRFIAVFMGTSLAYVIGVIEFFRASVIVNNREFKSVEIYIFAGIVYFTIDYLISIGGKKFEKKWKY